MKRKILLAINSFLALIVSLLGFTSCHKAGFGRIECIYGGPDMMNKVPVNPNLTEPNNDTKQIDTVPAQVEKFDTIKDMRDSRIRVMYGTRYKPFSEEKKEIVE